MLSAKGLEEKHTEHGDCKELGKTFHELLVQVELGTVTAGVKAVFGAVLPFPGGRVEMKETSSKKQMGVSIKVGSLLLGFSHTSEGCCFSILLV